MLLEELAQAWTFFFLSNCVVDIPIDSEEFAVPKGHNAPQHVHITQGDYDGKAVIISWITFSDPGSDEVLYGRSQLKYDHSAYGNVTTYAFFDYKYGYIHHCLVNGLDMTKAYMLDTQESVEAIKSLKM